jgi:CubicO group peptidase (beta-lactamase class C family)
MMMRSRSVFERPTLVGIALTSILGPATSYAADAEAQVRMHQVESQLVPTIPPDGRHVHATTLQQRMAALHVPGISIAVVHNGNIDWAKGYGVAWLGGPAVTSETLFQAASISKPVTALAVLHLVNSGKIALDHEVNNYLKDWKIPETPATAAAKVTVTELLNHTAGIHLEGFPGYGSSEMIPTLPQILRGESPAYGPAITVTSVPGSEFRYAGGGYVVLRKLLTDVTGQPFEELMHSLVFLPLGMEHSTFQQHLPSELAANAAVPHDIEGRPFKLGARIYPEEAPDGLWTTAADISRYILAMQKSLKGEGFLSKGIAQRMLIPGKEHWGLGPIVGKDAQHPYFMFSGGSAGTISVFVAYQRGDGVAVLTNGEKGGTLASEVVRTVARVYGWPNFQPVTRRSAPVAHGSLDGLAGAYRDPSGNTQVITRAQDDLFLVRMPGQNGPVRLYAQSKDKFVFDTAAFQNYPESGEVEVTFERSANGSGGALKEVLDGSQVIFDATRLTSEYERPVLQQVQAAALRYKKQIPAPGVAEALRHLIADVTQGKPENSHVGPGLTEVLRTDRIPNARIFSAMGPMLAVSYRGTSPGGYDTYRVSFSKRDCFFHVLTNVDGEIQDLDLRID